MIPKIAYFYWEDYPGEWCDGMPVPMSSLRKQSISTFRKFNPDWDVRMIKPIGELINAPGLRGIVLRSDYARYVALSVEGGFYFDTDQIFIKPIPEEWMKADVALSVGPEQQIVSVACLGATPDNRFFRKVVSVANEMISGVRILGHQSLGTGLFRLAFPNVGRAVTSMGLRFKNIPFPTMLPIPPDNILALWTPDLNVNLPDDTIAVHWYGGDRLSNEFERAIPKDCLVDRIANGL